MPDQTVKCAYCGHFVPAPDNEDEKPPEVDNDSAWAEVAKYHASDCEWVRTRAHRLPEANNQ